MKTTSIKRGSLVKLVVPIKQYNSIYTAGTSGQVTKVFRKVGKAAVYFDKDVGGTIVDLTTLVEVPQTNQKVPKVGDLFYTSWGYEQTNIDFYQVTKVISPSTIEVRSCGEKREYDQHMAGHVKADKDNLSGDPKKHRVSYDREGNPSFKVASYSRAWPTDENAEHFFSEWH